MKNVTLTLTSTVDKVYTGGESDGPFTFSILAADGSAVAQQKSSASSVTFPNVAPGDYTAQISKLDVSISADFTVDTDNVTFAVPGTMSVQVGEAPTAEPIPATPTA